MFPWPVYYTVLYHPTITAVCHPYPGNYVTRIPPLLGMIDGSITRSNQGPLSHPHRHFIPAHPLRSVWLHPYLTSRKLLQTPQQSPKNYKWVWQRCERLRHEMYTCGWHELCVTTVTLLLTCWRWVILVQIHSSHNINILNIAPINEAVNADSSVRSRGGERWETRAADACPESNARWFSVHLHFILDPSSIRRPSWR